MKDICLQYGMPHPLQLLDNPLSKQKLKCLVKTKITKYWEELLASEAAQLDSLSHFNPYGHSLASPHPLWVTAGSSPHEVNKSTILCPDDGYCLADTCHQVKGDLEHLLLHCPALHIAGHNLHRMWLARAAVLPPLHALVVGVLSAPPAIKMAFILPILPL